jgi:acyl carrier protein
VSLSAKDAPSDAGAHQQPEGSSPTQTQAEHELAELLVSALNLDLTPADVDPVAPLYGEGLGLDSIDILEVALEVSKRYGFELRSDDRNNVRIFTSLRSLATHIAEHRTR